MENSLQSLQLSQQKEEGSRASFVAAKKWLSRDTETNIGSQKTPTSAKTDP